MFQPRGCVDFSHVNNSRMEFAHSFAYSPHGVAHSKLDGPPAADVRRHHPGIHWVTGVSETVTSFE